MIQTTMPIPTSTNRRKFLQSTCCTVALTAFGAHAATENISPTIIDTHTHFYDPTRPQGVPWPDKNDKILYRRVRPEDYRALPKPVPVQGTVVVEASAWLEDNQWILDLA